MHNETDVDENEEIHEETIVNDSEDIHIETEVEYNEDNNITLCLPCKNGDFSDRNT